MTVREYLRCQSPHVLPNILDTSSDFEDTSISPMVFNYSGFAPLLSSPPIPSPRVPSQTTSSSILDPHILPIQLIDPSTSTLTPAQLISTPDGVVLNHSHPHKFLPSSRLPAFWSACFPCMSSGPFQFVFRSRGSGSLIRSISIFQLPVISLRLTIPSSVF